MTATWGRLAVALALVCLVAPAAIAQGPAPEATAAPPVLVVETQTIGIDPVVGRIATRRIRATTEALGYAPLDAGLAHTSMLRLGIPYPPSIADVWRITYATRAERGVFVVVWASGGRYLAEVRVASRDGTGPFYARGDSDAQGLESKLDALVREALPAPGATVASTATAAPASAIKPDAPVATAPEPKPEPEPESHRAWRFALQTESAIGLAEDPFYVHLVGARADLRFSPEFALGALGAYANLPGRDGRVTSLLTAVQVEQRIALTDGGRVALPLRLALGYLWRNGAVLRVAPGVAFALGDDADLVFDLAAPTFWVTPERTLFSLDFAVEVAWTP